MLIITTADIFFFCCCIFKEKKAYISEGRPVEMLIMNEHPIYSKYLDRLVQTVRTSIKLLLKQQFDQVYTIYHSIINFRVRSPGPSCSKLTMLLVSKNI